MCMNKQRVQTGFARMYSPSVALMVLAALTGQQAQATVAANVAGPITGRQIKMQGIPTLTGGGFVGESLGVTKPGTQDDDGDLLAGWRYVWKVAGTPVAAEAEVGPAAAIPVYAVKAADTGKAITLCLKARADKGFPASTQLSDEGCSNAITAKVETVTLANPGAQSVNENTVFNVVLTGSSDNPSAAYSWALSGADAARFTITPGAAPGSSATLSMTEKDYEAPQDGGGNNVYDVTVTLTNTLTGANTNRAISVTVNNVVEAGDAVVVVPGVGMVSKPSGSNYTWPQADSYCANLTQGGYSDWYLPSQSQLSAIYSAYPSNQVNTVLGWPTDSGYWSSTLQNAGLHYSVYLSNGSVGYTVDSSGGYVTCIR